MHTTTTTIATITTATNPPYTMSNKSLSPAAKDKKTTESTVKSSTPLANNSNKNHHNNKNSNDSNNNNNNNNSMTPEQVQQLQDIVSQVTSEVCIITLLKVLDNIIEEKVYNTKTRRFKLTNPTFQKRITSHTGGSNVLYTCGFDDKRLRAATTTTIAAASASAASQLPNTISSNHSVVSNNSNGATTSTVLELLPDQEDKEWLWQVRHALYQHGQTTLRLTKLPSMPAEPPKPTTTTTTTTSTTRKNSLTNSCSSQRTELATNMTNGKASSVMMMVPNEEEEEEEDEAAIAEREEEKKQESFDLQWESTNYNSSDAQRRRHNHYTILPKSQDRVMVAVVGVVNDGETNILASSGEPITSTAALAQPQPQHVRENALPLLSTDKNDAKRNTLNTAVVEPPELQKSIEKDTSSSTVEDKLEYQINSVTTAPLCQEVEGEEDTEVEEGDDLSLDKQPSMNRASSWESKLDEFLAVLDTEKPHQAEPVDAPIVDSGGDEDDNHQNDQKENPTLSVTPEPTNIKATKIDPTTDQAEGKNGFVDVGNTSNRPAIQTMLAPATAATTTTTSTLDLILADVDEASAIKLDSNTRRQMGTFLMDVHARRSNPQQPGSNNNTTPLAINIPAFQDIMDGMMNEGDNVNSILADMNHQAAQSMIVKSSSNVNDNDDDDDDDKGFDSILAEIDVVLRPDNEMSRDNRRSILSPASAIEGRETELPVASTNVSPPPTPPPAALPPPATTATTTTELHSITPPPPPSKSANEGSWSPKFDSEKQVEYINMLQESLSSVNPENTVHDVQNDTNQSLSEKGEASGVVLDESASVATAPSVRFTGIVNDEDAWNTLCSVVKKSSLSDEFEPCWGALCKLSEFCSNLAPPFDVLNGSNPDNKDESTKYANSKIATLRSWIPTDVVEVLWKIVMKDEGVNPARTEYVVGQLRRLLVDEHPFLEVFTGEELPHASWLRIPNEALIQAGTSLPDVHPKSEVWLLHLCDYLLEDATSWYGRYAVLEICGHVKDIARSERVGMLLNSIDFIQSRLDMLGLEQGTTRHIQDCKKHIDNLLCHEFSKEGTMETPLAVATEDIGLAVCQQIATCLYRAGQMLEKVEGTANQSQKMALARALHQLGLAVGEWRDYDFEMQLYGRALVIRREVCEPGCEEIGDTLLVIGACHQSQANLGAAMSCYEEALDMFKAKLGEHHDKVAEALHSIGVVHCERSELDAAMGNLKSSFKIRQDSRDSKTFDADMSDTLCWIGKVYREKGQLQKAYKYFATACASKEEITGKDSLDVAEILHNIAVIHDDQGEFDVSLEFYTKSLEIKRRKLGEDHEDVCELLTCIGHVYLLMGEDTKALKVFRRVLEKRTQVKSKNASKSQTHLLLQTYADVVDILRDQSTRVAESRTVKDYLAATLLEMGQLYEGVGEYEKCLACLDECLTIASDLNDHVRVGQALNTAGIAHAKRRHYDVAMDAFEQALTIRKGFNDEHSVDVSETLHNMGNCAAKQKDFDAARNFYEDSLRIKRKILGSSHPSVAQTLHNIGCIMSEQGFDDAAMNYLREALSVRRICLGEDDLEVAYSLHSIGKVQRRRNEIDDSIENFKESLRIKSRRLHKKQASVAETLEQLGELNAIKGDVEQTIIYFEEALIALKGSSNRLATATIHEALGKAYNENKDYPKAKSNYTKALKIAEKMYGSRDNRVASIIHRLGNVHRKLGDTQEALTLYQKATKICKDNLGRNDSTIADVLSDAGDLQVELGQFEVAHKCFSEALRIRRSVLKGGDLSIAESLLQLGDVEQFTGRFAHAIEYYNESAAIFRASEGDKSTKVADCLERLGCCHRALREFEKAVDFFEVCIRIRKDASDLQSLSLAEAYHQLGCVYFEIEEYSKAEQLFRDCVEIRVKELGEDHLDIADSVLMLGRVCAKIDSPHEAMMYFEQAQLIRKNQLGDKHLDYAELIREIGHVHEMNGDYKESLKNLNIYLQIRREAVGDDVVVGDVLHSIGSIEFTLQRNNASLKSLATALALFKVLLGDDNLSVAKTLYSLGLVYDAKSDDKEALKYHKEAFRLRRTLLGPDHLLVAQSLDSICTLYVRQQNHEKALQGLKEALRIRTMRLGNDNLEVAATLFGMGVVFCELGDRDRSKECYLASLKIRREHLGAASVEVGQTLHNLGSVCGQEQNYVQALRYWKKALEAYKGAGMGEEDHLSAITIGNINMAEGLLLEDGRRPQTTPSSLLDQPHPQQLSEDNEIDDNENPEDESDSWFQDD